MRRLIARLSRHVLWDSLLLFVPPVTAVVFIIVLLFESSWLGRNAAVVTASVSLALGALGVFLRRRPRVPSVRRVAQLVDQKSGAKDHFLTLATIDSTAQPSSFLVRLRRQSEAFLQRLELKRDFPYRVKRSAYYSIGASLLGAMLFYLFLPTVHSARYTASVEGRLRDLAQQMSAKPELRALSKELQDLATKLADPETTPEEKRVLAEKMERKLEEQQKKEQQKDNRDLLGEAASALAGKEQQQAASGQQQQKEQNQGGGGIQSNAPQDGQGENKQSSSGGGDGKSDSSAQMNKDMDSGKSSQADPKEPGQDKNRAGDAKNNQKQPDSNQPGNEPTKEKADKAQGGSKEGAGKQRASEEPPPQGGPPTERFYKPGEGKDGLAGKGYVTVQLPEEVAADAKGESRVSKDSKSNRARSQVPVSNVPLPAHVPDAPREKQQVPIEYRGIIR